MGVLTKGSASSVLVLCKETTGNPGCLGNGTPGSSQCTRQLTWVIHSGAKMQLILSWQFGMGCGDTTTSTLFLINGELRISIKSLTGSTVTAFISLAGKQAESCWGPLPVMHVRCHTGGNIIQMLRGSTLHQDWWAHHKPSPLCHSKCGVILWFFYSTHGSLWHKLG